MNKSEEYFHTLLRFGSRPGLDSTRALLALLDRPQDGLKFIHVAGTNGKGSVCTFIASILKEAGYKTGLYTSPYVVDFAERIQVNGVLADNETLYSCTMDVKSAIEELNSKGITVTEFEAVTAAAFLYYKKMNCDIVVLETGLGGRFDATNVIESPLECVLTSISLDHMAVLGDTVEKIAYEKCGIIKKNAAVITPDTQLPGVLDVIRERCAQENDDLTVVDTSCRVLEGTIHHTKILKDGLEITVPLAGEHQVQNALVAVSAVKKLRDISFDIPDSAIKSGIEKTKIHARCEVISENPLVLLDGGHNSGATMMLAALLRTHLGDKKIHAVLGMMRDKDISANLNNLLPLFESVITVTASNPRSATARELYDRIKNTGFRGEVTCADSFKDACGLLKSRLTDGTAGVVCGSLYLAGDMFEPLRNEFN